MKKIKYQEGVSLIELLIVILVFAVIGVLVTSSLFLTLRGTNKSQSMTKSRESLNLSLSIIQRQLRNATKILDCPNADTSRIDYIDSNDEPAFFRCILTGEEGYIASGSARLNSNEIKITGCSFSCVEGESGNPPSVTIIMAAEDATKTGIEKGRVSSTTKIFLRTY